MSPRDYIEPRANLVLGIEFDLRSITCVILDGHDQVNMETGGKIMKKNVGTAFPSGEQTINMLQSSTDFLELSMFNLLNRTWS